METQNITLALPKELLRRAKVAAARRNMSLSKLLTQALEEVVDKNEEYQQAMERHLAYLDNPRPLGFTADKTWTREDLHER